MTTDKTLLSREWKANQYPTGWSEGHSGSGHVYILDSFNYLLELYLMGLDGKDYVLIQYNMPHPRNIWIDMNKALWGLKW